MVNANMQVQEEAVNGNIQGQEEYEVLYKVTVPFVNF